MNMSGTEPERVGTVIYHDTDDNPHTPLFLEREYTEPPV